MTYHTKKQCITKNVSLPEINSYSYQKCERIKETFSSFKLSRLLILKRQHPPPTPPPPFLPYSLLYQLFYVFRGSTRASLPCLRGYQTNMAQETVAELLFFSLLFFNFVSS